MQCPWIIPKPSPSPPGCGKLSSTKSVPCKKKAGDHWVIQARIASTHVKLPGHVELQAVRVRRGFGADRPLSPPGGIPSLAVPCWEPRELAAHFSAALPTERRAFWRRQQGSSHACLCSILLWMVLLPLYHTCSDIWGYKGWVLSWLGNLQLLQSFRKEQNLPFWQLHTACVSLKQTAQDTASRHTHPDLFWSESSTHEVHSQRVKAFSRRIICLPWGHSPQSSMGSCSGRAFSAGARVWHAC